MKKNEFTTIRSTELRNHNDDKNGEKMITYIDQAYE